MLLAPPRSTLNWSGSGWVVTGPRRPGSCATFCPFCRSIDPSTAVLRPKRVTALISVNNVPVNDLRLASGSGRGVTAPLWAVPRLRPDCCRLCRSYADAFDPESDVAPMNRIADQHGY